MRRRDRLERVIAERLVFHLVTNQSIEGTLRTECATGWVLQAPQVLEPAGKRTDLAGELWIPREKVAFVQSAT